MANDNQTALMKSIQRRKDQLTFLRSVRDEAEIGDKAYRMANTILIHFERSIREDEKLLPTEKDEWTESFIEGYLSTDINGGESVRGRAILKFTQKYGSDE